MFGYLTAFQEMIEQVWAICMEWVMWHHFVGEKKIQVNNFLTWVDLFPCRLTVHVIIHELSKVGLKKLNWILPIVHVPYSYLKNDF